MSPRGRTGPWEDCEKGVRGADPRDYPSIIWGMNSSCDRVAEGKCAHRLSAFGGRHVLVMLPGGQEMLPILLCPVGGKGLLRLA